MIILISEQVAKTMLKTEISSIDEASEAVVADETLKLQFDEPNQWEVYKLLTNYNPVLGRMYFGTFKVLKDGENPIRHQQAADSIRGITSLISRSIELGAKNSAFPESDKSVSMTKLEACFKETIEMMPLSPDEEQGRLEKKIASDNFKNLKTNLTEGISTLVQKFRQLFTDYEDSRVLPDELKKDLDVLAVKGNELNKYFCRVVHYENGIEIREAEFMDNFKSMQDFWQRALTPLASDLNKVDALIKPEVPDGR